jgi:hypothetical protein
LKSLKFEKFESLKFRVPCSVFWVDDSVYWLIRLRVQCSMFRVPRSVFWVDDSVYCLIEFRVQCSVFRVPGSGLMIHYIGFRVPRSAFWVESIITKMERQLVLSVK